MVLFVRRSYVPSTDASAWKPNRAGLWNLLREGNGGGFHLDFSGPINLRAQGAPDAPPSPALLYVAGNHGFQPLAEAEHDGLCHFLSNGGLLLGEASGNSAEFRAGFEDMAKKPGAKLKPVKAGDAILSPHHVFSSPPPGAQNEGELLMDADAGIIFSTCDYGAAWGGKSANSDEPMPREHIRQAPEFGLNIIAPPSRRRRRRELCRALDGILVRA